MNKKRFFLLISAAVIILFVLASCGGESSAEEPENEITSGNTTEEQSESSSGSGEETTEEKFPAPELPEVDLGGADFVIMTNDYHIPIWSQRDIGAEEETGDSINDAVYRRNFVIEERYNCNIIENKVSDLPAQIRTFVRAGEAAVDAATIRLRDMNALITANTLIEFGDMSYIDTSKPWWDENCVKDLSIDNKIFGVASDMTLMDKDSTSAMVFNKKLQSDYQVEDLYQLVNDGKWTLDKVLELSKLVSVDVDGNGIRDDQDAYGLLYQRDTMTSFLSGCGEFIGKKDTNDLPILTLNTPKALEVLDKLYDILYDDTYCFHVMKFFDPKGIDFTEGMNDMFQADRALFMWIRMADVENLRNMDTDFGILPIPKYNEQQELHLQTVNPYVGVVTAVPQSVGSVENSSIILEAMSYESKYVLQPAYYDVVLNTKIARDEESSKMLDIIFVNRAYDIGDVFDFNGLGSDVINMSMTYDRNIVSTYEKKEARAVTAIEKLTAAVQAIE